MNKIMWSSKLVEVAKIKHTPKNYKIKTELGRERLQASLKSFGLAGNVVVNTDLTLIDGNSRLEEARENKVKKIWVSIPNRKLTPKEFNEMAALFDFAKAGDVDMESIQNDLGTTEDFYKKYHMEIPMHLLERMGKGAPKVETEQLEYNEDGKAAPATKMVQLFFNEKQEEEFRKLEDKLANKLKTGNTTDTALKVYRELVKQLKLK